MTVQLRQRELAASAPGNSAAGAAAGPHAGRIAYLINQYPKVSHSFIRREILALEQNGQVVDRIAVRGWDAEVVDPADIAEKERTRYLLKDGLGPLLLAGLRICAKRPAGVLKALRTALRLARTSERSWPYHIIYVLEACRALEWLEASEVAHVHAHFGTNSAEVALLVRLMGGPTYSFTVHGADETDAGARLGLDVKLHHAKFAAAVSAFTRSQLFRRTDPADWSKVHVVHCGLDPSFLESPPVPLPADPHIICVGRLSEEKGQIILLEALARLRAGGLACRLTLAGDGPMRDRIEKQMAKLDLTDAVEITGWLTSSEIRDRILNARALVCPSFMEGLPVVIMEAMALRRPVVASSIAGIPELVVPGETGWLVPAGDPDALAAALKTCLTTPEADMKALIEHAYHHVTERHSVSREAHKLAHLFFNHGKPGSLSAWRPQVS